jgi:hypothetical protein
MCAVALHTDGYTMMQQTAAEALLDALQRLPAAYAIALQQGDDSACTAMCQAAVAFAEAEVSCTCSYCTPKPLLQTPSSASCSSIC